MDESDTIHLALDKNETRTDKTSLEKEHRKLEENCFYLILLDKNKPGKPQKASGLGWHARRDSNPRHPP